MEFLNPFINKLTKSLSGLLSLTVVISVVIYFLFPFVQEKLSQADLRMIENYKHESEILKQQILHLQKNIKQNEHLHKKEIEIINLNHNTEKSKLKDSINKEIEILKNKNTLLSEKKIFLNKKEIQLNKKIENHRDKVSYSESLYDFFEMLEFIGLDPLFDNGHLRFSVPYCDERDALLIYKDFMEARNKLVLEVEKNRENYPGVLDFINFNERMHQELSLTSCLKKGESQSYVTVKYSLHWN